MPPALISKDFPLHAPRMLGGSVSEFSEINILSDKFSIDIKSLLQFF